MGEQVERRPFYAYLTPIVNDTRQCILSKALSLFCCIKLVGPTHKPHQSKIKLHKAIKYDWVRLLSAAQHFCIHSEKTNCLSLGSYCIASRWSVILFFIIKEITFVFPSSQCNYFHYHESSFVNITKAVWKGKIINKRLC